MINILLRYKYLEFFTGDDTRHDRHKKKFQMIPDTQLMSKLWSNRITYEYR